MSHFGYEGRHELVYEGAAAVEECVGVAYGTAQDAADHVACLGIRWQLAVGN